MKTLVISLALLAKLAVAQTLLPLTQGEVRKIDPVQQKITLKHGAILNLDMPPMTMVFKVPDPALLQQVKVGEQVLFSADKVQGVYTVLTLERVK